jgi:hypothetical protein
LNDCNNCFYINNLGGMSPCNTCEARDKQYSNWVAKDFLANVPDTPMKTAWFVKPNLDKDAVSDRYLDELRIHGMHPMKTSWSIKSDSDKDGQLDALRYGVKTGVKFDQDKPQWTLVPFKAFDEVVKVLTIGARKYAPDNWKKVPNARQRYIDAAFRHMSAYAAGEKLDDETGKSHLAHAMCCLLFLLAFDLDKTLEKTNG